MLIHWIFEALYLCLSVSLSLSLSLIEPHNLVLSCYLYHPESYQLSLKSLSLLERPWHLGPIKSRKIMKLQFKQDTGPSSRDEKYSNESYHVPGNSRKNSSQLRKLTKSHFLWRCLRSHPTPRLKLWGELVVNQVLSNYPWEIWSKHRKKLKMINCWFVTNFCWRPWHSTNLSWLLPTPCW